MFWFSNCSNCWPIYQYINDFPSLGLYKICCNNFDRRPNYVLKTKFKMAAAAILNFLPVAIFKILPTLHYRCQPVYKILCKYLTSLWVWTWSSLALCPLILKNHPVDVSALAVMQRVLSLLVLQVAAYHGRRKCGTSRCILSNQSPSNARWTRPSADFFRATNAVFWKDWKGSL